MSEESRPKVVDAEGKVEAVERFEAWHGCKHAGRVDLRSQDIGQKRFYGREERRGVRRGGGPRWDGDKVRRGKGGVQAGGSVGVSRSTLTQSC